MNRRKFSLGALAAIAALPFRRFVQAETVPDVAAARMSKAEWDKAVFGEHNYLLSQYQLVTDFVASKALSGWDLYLFKNRAGQFVYQVYDPQSGNPTAVERLYLMSGKPEGAGKWIMPRHMTAAKWQGASVVGIELNPSTTPRQMTANLNKAFDLLMKARAA